MKLRTRAGPRRAAQPAQPAQQAADSDVEEQEKEDTPLALRRPSRRSVMPRLVAETPVAAPARPRARAAPKAPKGGVQKRKVTRPRARPAAARTRRARPATPEETVLKEVDDDIVKDDIEKDDDGEEKEGKPVSEMNGKEDLVKEKRISTIDDLPEEVMLGIFSYFRPPQLCWKIGRVCQRWASWSVAPLLWRSKDYILSPHPNLSSRRNK